MIGRSKVFLVTIKLISTIAAYDAPVLIEGETGTGKELAARAIHYQGARHDHPFVPVNCGAIPDLLIENEFFGHCKGAFTDARDDQLGLIAHAHSGTLFLDEVDALTPKGQVTLLRFLQDQHYRPLGGRLEHNADVRIIAASNVNLLKLAQAGLFRMDLLYRLNILFLELPPLRERKGDPKLLAQHFMHASSERFAKGVKTFHQETLEWFDSYAWPGNVRELENMVYRGFLLAKGSVIRIPPINQPLTERRTLVDRRKSMFEGLDYTRAKAEAIDMFEREYLGSLMRKSRGNVTEAARRAGTERRCLGKLLRKYGIDKDQVGE